MKKKKIRKEFVIVGGVTAVFLLTVVISRFAGGGGLYDERHVTADFTENGVVRDENVGEDGLQYGYEGVVANEDVDELPSSALTVTGGSLQGGASSDVDETGQDVEDPVDDWQEPMPAERLSPQQYVDLAMHYVCGTKDVNFDTYLTVFLKHKFDSLADTEPYSSLSGNTTFNNVSISNTDSSFSFEAGDGVTYTVMVLFNGSLIASIEVI